MPEPNTCPKCGVALPAGLPHGLCPKCLLAEGVGSTTSTGGQISSDLQITKSMLPGLNLEKPDDRIGRYKLLQMIGEGGCGIVYMAEQEEPVKRRVALKVIKPGLDTKEVIARFEAERQALALMDHPNIAKVLDGGATQSPHPQPLSQPIREGGRRPGEGIAYLPAGRPYFVMELVRGIKITEYCDQNNLSTARRLELFVQVCKAIQHAHQKGIIHRDIKPSNILVTLHDGVPVPKVIDFGIAKATAGQTLTDKTVFTAFEQFMGTPAYMSPEQAEMSGLDIDTRSDIYSLGVLLYELLTGKTPFEAKDLMAAGLDEMRRVIRQKDPVRPSTRLSNLGADEQTTVAKRRQLEAPKLIRLVRGDLDWIAMRCLEKDRTRRYETANGLATDIGRYLDSEPVVARPPSSAYRFQKLVRRNKLAFGAAGAVAAALLIGLGVSTWMFIRERAERQRAVTAERAQSQLRQQAQTEVEKSKQVTRFLEDMLQAVGPSTAKGRDTTMLREVLSETERRLGRELTNQPEVQVELHSILGETYKDLLLHDKMAEQYREALRLGRERLGETHPSVATSVARLGYALAYLYKFEQAEPYVRQGLAMQRKVLGERNRPVAESLDTLTFVLRSQKKFAEAEKVVHDELAMTKDLFGEEDASFIDALQNLAATLFLQGRLADGEATQSEVVARMRKLYTTEHSYVANALANLGVMLAAQEKLADAETVYRESLAIRSRLFGDRLPPIATASLQGLIGVLSREGKPDEAQKYIGELYNLAVLQQPQSAEPLLQRGVFAAERGRWKDAAPDLAKALALEPTNHFAYHLLAPVLLETGDVAGYERCCQAAFERFKETTDPNIAERIAKTCLILPRASADLQTLSRMTDTALSAGTNHWAWVYFEFAKGLAEYRQDHFESAVEWMRRAVAAAGDNANRDVEAQMVLAMAQAKLSHPQQAREALAKGDEIMTKNLPALESGNLGAEWNDWVVAHFLEREARALIEGNVSGTAKP